MVVPVLLLLAVTGLIYLFRFQTEPLLNADVMTVDPPANATADLRRPLDAVQAAHPDATIVSMSESSALDRSTAFSTTTADGQPRDVYVNLWDANVLGSINPDTTLSGHAVRLHGELTWCVSVAACLTGKYRDIHRTVPSRMCTDSCSTAAGSAMPPRRSRWRRSWCC
ncbi:hypothetical protein DMB66_07365 [Actinoplanes sp. ATCC 53533]|nr:hypothetical protein DMB66_07365 [Actinoplanes sp. ATCC 53533]